MATNARDILALVHDHAGIDRPTLAEAESAIAALRYPAAVLTRLVERHGDSVLARWKLVEELSAACGKAANDWPRTGGRLTDLVGVGCDAFASQTLVEHEAWSVTVQLASTVRTCTDLARRHPPYAAVPVLRRVREAAVAVEREGALHPPDRAAATGLDRPIPGFGVGSSASHVLDAMGRLQQALRRDTAVGPLPVAAAIATAAAAETIAQRCAETLAVDAHLSPDPCMHAPAAWRVVQAVLVRFDDGSRGRPPEPVTSVEAAQHLLEVVNRVAGRCEIDPEISAAVRSAARQLGPLARQLNVASTAWANHRSLYARAHDLAKRGTLVPAMLRRETVRADDIDLIPVMTALRVTARLSAELVDRVMDPTSSSLRLTDDCLRTLQTDARWAARLAERVDYPGSPSRVAHG